jgi:hypothetical protein
VELLVEEHIAYTKNFTRQDAHPFRETIIATMTTNIDAVASAPCVFIDATKDQEAVSATASIAQAPNTVVNDTESDSD